MFVKTFRENINFNDILANEGNDLALFKLMKEKIKAIGIDSILITAMDRNNSYCIVGCKPNVPFSRLYERERKYYKNIPILKIYVRSNKNYLELNVNEYDSSFVDNDITSSVIKLWEDALFENNYNLDKYYDLDMMIKVISFPRFYIISQIYALRDNVESEIKRMKVVLPKEIYCSTLPSYNVIYETYVDYEKAQLNGEFQVIKCEVDKILKSALNDKFKSIVEEYDYVKFYHPEMDGFNWYGFARQD